MDILNRALKWIDHNRNVVLALVVVVGLIAGMAAMIGCASKTGGVIEAAPGQPVAQVTRQELLVQATTAEKQLAIDRATLDARVAAYNEEVEALNARVELGLADLDRQDEFRGQVIEVIGLVGTQAAAGTINPAALIPLAVGLLGGGLAIGAGTDNRRKDRIIKDLKTDDPT